jgi:predicted choloylglycine hydrolase
MKSHATTAFWRLGIVLVVGLIGVGCGSKTVEETAPETAAAVEEAPPVETKPAKPAEPAATKAEMVTPAIAEGLEAKLLDEEGAGKLFHVGEHVVCVMEGSHAAMGFQHGRLLAKRIQHTIREGYAQKALYAKGYTEEYVNAQCARMVKHFPPTYVEELKGMVEGLRAAGIEDVTYEHVLVMACIAELQHHGPDAPPGCTNFAVFGQWTTDGRLLHGRNLDWDITSGAQEGAVILVWRPEGGTPFMMPSWAGCLGGVSGMNAKGITIGEMTSKTTDETFDGVPLMVIMRRVVEEAASLDEAVAIMEKGPRTLGWNFIIGDAQTPDARALEVDARHCAVFAPLDPKEGEETGHQSMKDAVRRTNHPCGKVHLEKLLVLYKDKVPAELDLSDWNVVKGLLKTVETWDRYDWLGTQIQAQPGGIDVKEALQLLANGPVQCDVTLHSWVFDPKNNAAYIANAGWNPPVTASSRAYAHIDLAPWFK